MNNEDVEMLALEGNDISAFEDIEIEGSQIPVVEDIEIVSVEKNDKPAVENSEITVVENSIPDVAASEVDFLETIKVSAFEGNEIATVGDVKIAAVEHSETPAIEDKETPAVKVCEIPDVKNSEKPAEDEFDILTEDDLKQLEFLKKFDFSVSDRLNASKFDNEIPAITFTKPRSKLAYEKYMTTRNVVAPNNKLPQLFIRDILMSEPVTSEGNKIHYKIKNFEYNYVLFQGVVIEVFVKELKAILRVEDCTGSIGCILNEDEELTRIKELASKIKEDIQKLKDGKSDVEEACQTILEMIDVQSKDVPDHKAYETGDKVVVIGRINDYNGQRYCFVNKINREWECCMLQSISFMKDVKHLYESVYNQDVNYNS